MILLVAAQTSTETPTTPTGWTVLFAGLVTGTMKSWAYIKRRDKGDTTYTLTFSATIPFRAVTSWYRGCGPLAGAIMGTYWPRSGHGTTLTTIAPSITTVEGNSLDVILGTERTTAAETTYPTADNSAVREYFSPDPPGTTPDLTNVAFEIARPTAGPTPDVTITYENAQATNAAAGQIAFPPKHIPAGGFTVANFLLDTPWLYAHRGSGGWWPEETMYAFRQSIKLDGRKAIDLDVWECADSGVFVCQHDQNTSRMCTSALDIPTTPWVTLSALMTNPIGCSDTAQAQQPICRLEEVLNEFMGQCVISMEMKGPSAGINRLLTLLNTYPTAKQHIIYQGAAAGLTQMATMHDAGYKTMAVGFDADPVNNPTQFSSSKVDICGLNWDALAANWTAMLAFGKPVMGHIIGSKTQGDTALAAGATGLTVRVW